MKFAALIMVLIPAFFGTENLIAQDSKLPQDEKILIQRLQQDTKAINEAWFKQISIIDQQIDYTKEFYKEYEARSGKSTG